MTFRRQPKSAFSCDQALVATQACKAGLGFVLPLSYQAEPGVKSGELEVVLEEFEPPPRAVQLAYPSARRMSSRVRRTLDFLGDELRERQPGTRP